MAFQCSLKGKVATPHSCTYNRLLKNTFIVVNMKDLLSLSGIDFQIVNLCWAYIKHQVCFTTAGEVACAFKII